MNAARSGAGIQAGNRLAGYYCDPRPDVAALVPARCRRVLDIGCGRGELGKLLKARGHAVTGVELVPEAAEQARCFLDEVETADIELQGLPFPTESFDVVILADVLEHLIDPWRIVRQAAALLVADGCVVASVPNVQNIDVLRRLARGRWDYRERGILDRGHLRFFTLKSLRELFEQAGLYVTTTIPQYRPSLPRTLVSWLTAGRARSYLARRYLVLAQK